MGKFIVKLAEDEYVEWSTVVDAPITYICTREEMAQHLLEEYGHSHEPEIPKRLRRADQRGHSALWFGPGLELVLSDNRAGPDGTEASLEEIRRHYRE